MSDEQTAEAKDEIERLKADNAALLQALLTSLEAPVTPDLRKDVRDRFLKESHPGTALLATIDALVEDNAALLAVALEVSPAPRAEALRAQSHPGAPLLGAMLATIDALKADNAALLDALQRVEQYEQGNDPSDSRTDMLATVSDALARPNPGAALLERMKRLEETARSVLAHLHDKDSPIEAGEMGIEDPSGINKALDALHAAVEDK